MPFVTERLLELRRARDEDYIIWDTAVLGFGVRITTDDARVFVVSRNGKNPDDAEVLAEVSDLGVRQARREAKRVLADGAGLAPKRRIAQPRPAPIGPRRTEREQALDRTRERIVDAARRVFLDQGFAANMSAIAAAAEVSRPTLYAYFPDKETIFDEVLLGMALDLVPDLESLYRDTVEETLLAFATAYRKGVLSEEGVALYRVVSWDFARFAPLANQSVAKGAFRLLPALADYLRGRIAAGELVAFDCDIAAEWFLSAAIGITRTRWMLQQEIGGDPDEEAYIRQAVRLFLDGVRPR